MFFYCNSSLANVFVLDDSGKNEMDVSFFASIFLFIIFFRPNLFGLSSEQIFVLIGRDVCLFLRSNRFK